MPTDRIQLTVILLTCITSATILTAMKILPAEIVSHMLMTCVGGALMGMVPGFANRPVGASVPVPVAAVTVPLKEGPTP